MIKKIEGKDHLVIKRDGREQKFTPKYWIGHDTKNDDVFLDTAKKGFDTCDEKMSKKFGENWKEENPSFEISLVEINLVDMKRRI